MKMEKIILIGAGGHCKVVIDAVLLNKQFKIAGITDSSKKKGERILGLFPIIGGDEQLIDCFKKGIKNCFITVGSTGNPVSRVKIFEKIERIGYHSPNIIHPRAIVSKFTKMGDGNFIAAGAVINPGTVIGSHCIINTGSRIDHDCIIGDFVHIAPGSSLSGRVTVGNCSHIGTGSSVIQCVNIGKNTVIGCGSNVINDIGDNKKAFGNPCRTRHEGK